MSKMKVVFADDAFDGMDEDEIEELKKEILAKIEDGSFFSESEPVDFNQLEQEDPETYERLMGTIEDMPLEGPVTPNRVLH